MAWCQLLAELRLMINKTVGDAARLLPVGRKRVTVDRYDACGTNGLICTFHL